MLTDRSRLIPWWSRFCQLGSLYHPSPPPLCPGLFRSALGPLVLLCVPSTGVGKAICYIIVASGWYKSLQGTHKKLLQMYKKGEGGAFNPKTCRQSACKVPTTFAVEKRRRKRMSKVYVNVLAPKGGRNVYDMRDERNAGVVRFGFPALECPLYRCW
jgi:hypothetical protein